MATERAAEPGPKDEGHRQRELEALRRFLATRDRVQSIGLAAAEADKAALEEAGPGQRQLVSLFESDQPDPACTMAAPAPAGKPQPVTPSPAPRQTTPAWVRLAPVVTLAVGLAAGYFLKSASGGEPPSVPAPVTQTSIVVRPAATSACLETARRGDQLLDLLIRNRRSRAAGLLVPYHVASRQCARDADP